MYINMIVQKKNFSFNPIIARAILKLHSPGGGGGANLAPPPPDLGRGARDRREILHKYRGQCSLQDCIIKFFL